MVLVSSIAGTNGEVMPGQWEFQVGPCEGIEAGALKCRFDTLRPPCCRVSFTDAGAQYHNHYF